MRTGTTFAFFQISGNLPSFRDCSYIILKGTVHDSLLQILIIFIDIFSQPLALAGSKFFIINDMSSSVKSNDVILALVLYENNGNTLESFVSVLIDAKKLLKRFALSQQSEKNLPLTNKGGIAGTFSL